MYCMKMDLWHIAWKSVLPLLGTVPQFIYYTFLIWHVCALFFPWYVLKYAPIFIWKYKLWQVCRCAIHMLLTVNFFCYSFLKVNSPFHGGVFHGNPFWPPPSLNKLVPHKNQTKWHCHPLRTSKNIWSFN